MKLHTTTFLFAALLSYCRATTIIDTNNLNGSFESGTLSPWSGGSAVHDTVSAPDGEWYAQTVASVNRASLYVFFTDTDTSRKDFTLSFHARAVNSEFDILDPYLFGRTESNGFIYGSVISSSGAPLTDGWNSYEYTFRFSSAWDISKNMSMGFDFKNGQAGSVGLIDDVVLTQIPEPGNTAILIAAASLFYFIHRRKTRNINTPQNHLS